jgi:hypothetical protein
MKKECLFTLVNSEWELVEAHDSEVIIDTFEAGRNPRRCSTLSMSDTKVVPCSEAPL